MNTEISTRIAETIRAAKDGGRNTIFNNLIIMCAQMSAVVVMLYEKGVFCEGDSEKFDLISTRILSQLDQEIKSNDENLEKAIRASLDPSIADAILHVIDRGK